LARRTNSPWSKTYKEGLSTSAVNDHVNIDQNVSATITTGVIDSTTGQWKGITVTDDAFTIDAVHEAVPNTGAVTSPQGAGNAIDMTGYNDLFFAIKPTNGGNFALECIMSGDVYYANLTPPNGGAGLRYVRNNDEAVNQDLVPVFNDGGESLTADVWNIYVIQARAKGWKSLDFKITNNSGGESDIQFAYLRVV